MTLSGWKFLTQHIMDLNFEAACVIRRGNINYIKPVKKDIEVICEPLSKDEWEKFIVQLTAKSSANIFLNAKIYVDKNVIVDFTGDYAAWKIKNT